MYYKLKKKNLLYIFCIYVLCNNIKIILLPYIFGFDILQYFCFNSLWFFLSEVFLSMIQTKTRDCRHASHVNRTTWRWTADSRTWLNARAVLTWLSKLTLCTCVIVRVVAATYLTPRILAHLYDHSFINWTKFDNNFI